MATFKQHKGKYRWLTNAFQTMFSNIALLLTITSKVILDSLKSWACLKNQSYKNFLQVNTSTLWIVDSIIDTTLNLPSKIEDILWQIYAAAMKPFHYMERTTSWQLSRLSRAWPTNKQLKHNRELWLTYGFGSALMAHLPQPSRLRTNLGMDHRSN